MKARLDNWRLPVFLLLGGTVLVVVALPFAGKAAATLSALALLLSVCAVGAWGLPRLIRSPLSIEETVAAVPAVGISLVALPAFLGAVLDLPFVLATPLFLLPVVLFAFRIPQRIFDEPPGRAFLDEVKGYWPLAVVAIALAGVLLVLATLSPRHLDGWATTAIMRAYRDETAFEFSGSFRLDDNAWPAALAYISWVIQVDALVLYRTILPPLVVMAALTSAWGLAMAVFQRRGLALLTMAVQALVLLTSITAFGFQPGWQVLFSAAEDKTVAGFVLLPVAMMFLVRALREEQPAAASYLPFAVVALGIGVIHPFVALMLGMVSGMLLLLRAVVQPRSVLGAAIPLAVVVVALLPALVTYADVTDKTDDLLEPSGEVFIGNQESAEQLGSINFLGDGWAVVHFRTITQPLLLAGGALALLALLRFRDPGRQYMLAALLVVALVAFNPLAIRLLSYLTTTTITWRLTWLLPAALGVAGAVGLLLDRRPEAERSRWLAASAVGLVIVFSIALLGPWTNRAWHNLDVSAAPERIAWEAPIGSEELAAALRDLDAEGDVVLAPTLYNFVLPSFTSEPQVVFRGQGLVQPSPTITRARERYEDIAEFYAEPSEESLLTLREKYSVDYLVTFGPVEELCDGGALASFELTQLYAVDDDGC